MSAEYEFRIVDVFAEARFGGNQLAVLPDARGMSTDEMQAVARELNFAETTFVLPPKDPAHTAQVRIFTPKAEMPFAGHPTVGTGAVLAALGRGTELVLEEGVGPIRVVAKSSAYGYEARFTLSQTVELPAEAPDRATVARALSLDDVTECWFAAIGTRFCFARVGSPRDVDAAVLDHAAWAAGVAKSWAPGLYVFAGDPSVSGEIYARMFAPALGVAEDSATGSAAAILAGSGAAKSALSDGELRLRIRQGIAMGRPSVIEVVAEKHEGRTTAIHVRGQVIFIAKGMITVRTPRPI